LNSGGFGLKVETLPVWSYHDTRDRSDVQLQIILHCPTYSYLAVATVTISHVQILTITWKVLTFNYCACDQVYIPQVSAHFIVTLMNLSGIITPWSK
jgi:hypothetical protein